MKIGFSVERQGSGSGCGTAHKILVATYHMLSRQVSYHELGDLYLDKLNKHHLTRNLVHRLERFGYTVTLTLEQKAA
jgi:transposase